MHVQMIRTLIWPLAIAGVLLMGLWLVNTGLAQEPEEEGAPQHVGVLSSTVDDSFTYQGRLTDDDGTPLNGSHTMRFFLYDQAAGGSALYDSGNLTVAVDDGLFAVELGAPQNLFDGQALWLQITVEGETLSPRQAIRPAPYAMGLRPGASIETADAGNTFSVRNTATGAAVRGESEDVGLFGESANFAVYGRNQGGVNGAGYGGYFESATGIGVFGGSTAVPSTTNPYVPGVYGYSEYGAGVYGTSDSTFGYGVFGEHDGTGIGTYGRTATGYGVLGVSDGVGVFGSGEAQGVYGSNTGPAAGTGYGGYFESTTGDGVFGSTTAVPSTTNSLPAGVYGVSENGAGVYGKAGGNFAWGGYFDGNVRIDGSLVVSDSLFANDKSGYVFDVALNADTDALTSGDVVVVTGVAPDTVFGDIPVFTVVRATSAESTGVVGVVDRRYVPAENGRGQMEDSPAAPGDYVGVVTLGALQGIKVDASYGAIRAGDLLVSSPTPGHAMRADDPGIGTVIGKALGELDEGAGVIAVMVSLK